MATNTTDTCLDACTADGCLNYEPDCDNVIEYARKDFDNNKLQGMTIVDSNPGDEISWHLTTETSVSYPYSIHLGHPLCGLYYNGPVENCVPTGLDEAVPMNVRLETETITLDEDVKAFLGFWVRMGAKEATPEPQDALRVLIETGDESDSAWESIDAFGEENTTMGEWTYHVVKLNKYKDPFKIVFELTATAKASYQGSDGTVLKACTSEIVVQTTCDAASCTAKTKPCPNDGMAVQATFTLYSTVLAASVPIRLALERRGLNASHADSQGIAVITVLHVQLQGTGCDIELAEKCCASYTLFPGQPPPVTVFEAENSLEGWTLDDPTDDNVTWQIKNTSAYD